MLRIAARSIPRASRFGATVLTRKLSLIGDIVVVGVLWGSYEVYQGWKHEVRRLKDAVANLEARQKELEKTIDANQRRRD